MTFGLTLIITSSCAVIKNTEQPNLDKIDTANLKNVEGKYFNTPIGYKHDSVGWVNGNFNQSLWCQMDKYKDWKQDWRNQTIVLKVISDKKIMAELYEGGKLINQKILKGKIKEGYFYGRPFFILIPFIPIVWGYDTHRFRIGLMDTTLIVDRKTNYWIMTLFGENYKKEQLSLTFDRK